MRQTWQSVICVGLFACLVLLSCSDSSDKQLENAGKFGRINQDSPQFTALQFADALYRENDLAQLKPLTTEQYFGILKAYHTAKNVQRLLLNLRLDPSSVDMKVRAVSLSESLGFEPGNQTVTLIMSGHFDGDKTTELLDFVLEKQRGRWYVASVSIGRF